MATITLDEVTKRFGSTTAVDEVSLTVRNGDVMGVVGPSGCGKTTTLRTIAGFETPTRGAILFDDEEMTHVPPERRPVGLVFQSYALFGNMTVRENVEFGPKMHGVSPGKRRETADQLLDLLGIGDLADRDPATLSGGQQQRVGLARALAVDPEILLLDEPMTGLDAQLKRRLRTEIRGLLDELEVTALYVTHDQDEAMAMCDRIAVMNEGRVEQVGTPSAVYERPANAFVADFVGASNLLTGEATAGRVDLGFAAVDDVEAGTGEVTLSVRPTAFDLDGDDIDATVLSSHYLGDTTRLEARLPDGEDVTVEAGPAARGLAAGDPVSLSLDADAIHVVGVGRADGG